jgi:hypothetical protein
MTKKIKGYEVEGNKEEFIHRKRAYHIYLENRDKYPLPYSAYEVHHIDFDKTNNKVSNLQILTPSEHDKLHEEHDKNIEMGLDTNFCFICKKRLEGGDSASFRGRSCCSSCWINIKVL